MRSLWLAAAVAIAACAPMPEAKHRWPNHRQDHDSALAQLKQQNVELQARVDKLERAVDALRRVLKQRSEAPPAVAAPSASNGEPAPSDGGAAPAPP